MFVRFIPYRARSAAIAGLLSAVFAHRAISGAIEDLQAITTIMTERFAIAQSEIARPGYDIHLTLRGFMDLNLDRPSDVKPEDMTLLLRRRGDKWIEGPVHGWTAGAHTVVPLDLKDDGQTIQGTVRLTLDPRGFRSPFGRPLNHSMLPPYPTEPVVLDVDLNISRSAAAEPLTAVLGNYSRAEQWPYPAVADSVTGTLQHLTLPPLPVPGNTPPLEAACAAYHAILNLEALRLNAGSAVDRPDLPLAVPKLEGAAAASYINALRRTLEEWRDDGFPPPSSASGPISLPDKVFGPYYGNELLTSDDGFINRLPEDAGAEGHQAWLYVGHWRMLGAFPSGLHRHRRIPSLPVVAPGAYDAEWAIEWDDATFAASNTLYRWQPVSSAAEASFITVDLATSEKGHGKWVATPFPRAQNTAMLAAAQIEAPREQELWIGTGVRAPGVRHRLWLNGRLIWSSADVDEPSGIGAAVIRVPFKAGTNSVLLWAESSWFEHGILQPVMLGVCVRGNPLEAEAAEQQQARIEQQIHKTEQTRASVHGYLGNRRSNYPDASPPLVWNLAENINVRWRRKMEHPSHGNPLILDGLVITTGEPDWLYALDADTGKEIWRRQSSIFELVMPGEQERAEALRTAALAAEPVMQEFRSVERNLRKDDLTTAERGSLAQQLENLRPLFEAGLETTRQWGALSRQVDWGGFPWYHTSSWSTPVTDGTNIWVKFGTGVAACYDLKGNRRWMVETHAPRTGTRCSPLLVDGKLIIMTPHPEGRARGSSFVYEDGRNFEVIALDSANGKVLWRTPVRAGDNEGSPVLLTLGNGTETLDVIYTPLGSVLRVADGATLIDQTGMCGIEWQMPAWCQDRVFTPMSYGSVSSGRLLMLNRDHAGFNPLWRTMNIGHSQIQGHGRYMLFDGQSCIQMGPRRGVGQDMSFQEAALFDANDGRLTHFVLPVFGEGETTYGPHAAAGGFLFMLQTTHLAVLSGGPRPKVLARNRIPRTYSAPVFNDDRIYLRGVDELVCFQHIGESGRHYENTEIARHVLTELGPRPSAAALRNVPPVSDFTPKQGEAVWPISRRTASPHWWYAGPLPIAGEALPEELAAGGMALRPEMMITQGTNVFQVQPVPDEFLKAQQGGSYYLGRYLYSESTQIDLLGVISNRAYTTSWYGCMLYNSRERVVSMNLPTGYAAAWLAGEQIESRVPLRLQPGYYPLTIRISFRSLPPLGRLALEPHLSEQRDPAWEYRKWVEKVEHYRPELERIIRTLPATDFAAAAQTRLSHITKNRQDHPAR